MTGKHAGEEDPLLEVLVAAPSEAVQRLRPWARRSYSR